MFDDSEIAAVPAGRQGHDAVETGEIRARAA
jgi:hypothetical protein